MPQCPVCQAGIPQSHFNTRQPTRCPRCDTQRQVEVFPALFRHIPLSLPGGQKESEDQAGCFYHPEKSAAAACGSCGRFLCSLCELAFNGQVLCPVCLENGVKNGDLKKLEKKRKRYDSSAFGLAVLGLFPSPFLPPIGLLPLILTVFAWNKPHSLVSNPRPKLIIFSMIGLLEAVFGSMLFYFMFLE